MKICLSIETTQRQLGVGLYRFGAAGAPRAAAVYFDTPDVKQSDVLIPTLTTLLKKTKLSKQDIALIAVDIGPGSFTGVRVGLSVARTLAQSLALPVVGVTSLEAMAWTATQGDADQTAVCWLPATSGEIFYAAYRGGKALCAPAWGAEKDVNALRKKHSKAVETTMAPHPDAVAAIAVARFQKTPVYSRFHFEKAQPLYLQPSWAERSKASA